MEKYRRDLHKIPEIGFNEFKTKEYILSCIKSSLFRVIEIGQTSFGVYFDFNKESTICFRSELDALPIEEKNEVEYKSSHQNMMHACGHDGHMAILISLINDLENQIIKPMSNILFLFQASEEIYGGSLEIIKSGILSKLNVNEIYALHIWPCLPKGKIYTKKDEILAKSTEFDIDIRGKNTNVACFKNGKDALSIGVELLHDIKKETRLITSSIVHVGELYSIGQRNIVCDNFSCKGTIRTFSLSTLDRICNIISRWVNFYKEVYDIQIDLDINSNNQSVCNNNELVEKSYAFGVEELDAPYFNSEDFSLYLQNIPGVFFLLGAGEVPPLHSSNFNFNEEILQKGKELFRNLMTKQLDY